MAATALRLLRLLSLLQTRSNWTGHELADRLGTTERTVRRDVTKLRDLGYAVDAAAGRDGGYRLASGNGLPPLLLHEDEAIAMVVALRVAATGALPGLEDALLGALAKLTQVLPVRLRHRIEALDVAVAEVGTPAPPSTSTCWPCSLVDVAAANGRILYRGVQRDIEPYRLTYQDGRWYVLTRDPRKAEWRTLRVDHITSATLTGHQFVLRQAPGQAPKAEPQGVTARILAQTSARRAAAYVPPAAGRIDRIDNTSCILTLSAEDTGWLTKFLLRLPFATEVIDPPQLRRHIRSLGERLVQTHS